MKSGALGLFAGGFDTLDAGVFPNERKKRGTTLRDSLEAGRTERDLAGNEVLKGQAATQDVKQTRTYTVRPDGKIDVGEEGYEKITDVSEFISSLGEFAVTSSTKSLWVFDLLELAAGVEMHPTTIDLDAFIRDHKNASYPMGGFYDRRGDIESGDAHGEGDIFEDEELGPVLREADKNRIRVKFTFETDDMDVLITRSGYVEVYKPKSYETLQYTRLLDEEILPYAEPRIGK